MPNWIKEKAEGRKEIQDAIGASWRTIQRHRSKDKDFRKLFNENPVNGKPFIVLTEYYNYLLTRNNKKRFSNILSPL